MPTSELSERRQNETQATGAPSTPERKPSPTWNAWREELKTGINTEDFNIHIIPLRGTEDDNTLWLEAPNRYVAEWVRANMGVIEQTIRPHTRLGIRVCIG